MTMRRRLPTCGYSGHSDKTHACKNQDWQMWNIRVANRRVDVRVVGLSGWSEKQVPRWYFRRTGEPNRPFSSLYTLSKYAPTQDGTMGIGGAPGRIDTRMKQEGIQQLLA